MKTYKYIALALVFCLFSACLYAQTQNYPNRALTYNTSDQSETMIAVNPVNNSQIVGVWNDYRATDGIYRAGVGYSTDGGSIWFEDTLNADEDGPEGLNYYSYGTNPAVAFDRNGNMFYAYMAINRFNGDEVIVVAKKNISSGGWVYKILSTRTEGQDKPWITVDNTGGSRDGTIYVTWTDITDGFWYDTYKILESHSTDGGSTFSTPYQIDATTGGENQPIVTLKPSSTHSEITADKILQGSMPAVGPDGEVYIVWCYHYATTNYYKTSKSTNGGTTWSSPTNGPSFNGWFMDYNGTCRILPLPSLAVAPNGDLLLAFTDYKSSNDQNFRVKFSKSTNGGTNWATPVILPPNLDQGWQYFGCITVNSNGRTSVGYMHCQNPPQSYEYSSAQQARLLTSTDYGESWSVENAANQTSTPPVEGQTYEYMGLTSIASNNQIFYLWTDHHNNNANPYYLSLLSIESTIPSNWSMLSLPDTIDYACPNADCIYGDRTAGLFAYVDGQYEDYYDLEPGTGYWVKYTSQVSKTYRGVPVYKCTLDVVSGWNLIGNISFNMKTTKIKPIDCALSSPFYTFTGSYVEEDTLKPGVGYWIKVNMDGQLELNVNSTYSGSTPSSQTPPPAPSQTPGTPTLASPSNGATSIPINTTVYWHPASASVSYNMHIQNYSGSDSRDYYDISDTSYSVTNLAYNTTYYWKVQGVNGNGETGSWSSTWSFTTRSDPGGGCPYVLGWNGENFIEDNNILPQSEYKGNENQSVTDYYKLLVPPQYANGRYILKLKEFENEMSQLDRIQLIAFDHTPQTDIAVLLDGSIVHYEMPFSMKGQFAEKLGSMEGNVIHVAENTDIALDFKPIKKEYFRLSGVMKGGVLLGGWIDRGRILTSVPPPPKEEKIGFASNRASIEKVTSPFTFRERTTVVYVPIENVGRNVSLRFDKKVAIDYANLAVEIPAAYTEYKLNLHSAIHNRNGDITSSLTHGDGSAAALIPGETITLEYDAPPLQPGMIRSFVIVSSGCYEHIPIKDEDNRPLMFELLQNHPNPFNPITRIEYSLPKDMFVKLVVYNILGEEVARLVDEYQTAGVKSVEFDASKLPSGMYMYQLHADKYSETRKMLLLR